VLICAPSIGRTDASIKTLEKANSYQFQAQPTQMNSIIQHSRNAAPFILHLFLVALFIVAGGALTEAREYSVKISGTVDTFGNTVHGQNGSAIPVNLTLTFETDNGGQIAFAAQGTTPPDVSSPLGSNFHGYGKANITATNVTFGTRTWTQTHIFTQSVGTANVADIWFNAPIDENPTRIMMRFQDSTEFSDLGFFRNFGAMTDFDPGLVFFDGGTGGTAVGPITSLSVVPFRPARFGRLIVRGPSRVRRKITRATYKVKIPNVGYEDAENVKIKVLGKGIVRTTKSVQGKILARGTETIKLRVKFKLRKPGKIKASFRVTSSNAGSRSFTKRIKVK